MKEKEQKSLKNYIVIANHNKWLDSWLVYQALNKSQIAGSLRPMMADRLSKTPLGIFYKLLGAFPANSWQGLDKSLETPKRYLAEGHSILIYPQGAPSKGKRETKPGARELSLRTGIPIIPILIKSPKLSLKEIFLKEHEAEIIIGQPFIPEPEEDVMERVWALETNKSACKLSTRTGVTLTKSLIKISVGNFQRVFLRKN